MDLIEGISIVIVTYNGKKRLDSTLTHLANQLIPDVNVELLIIDNNSNDGTREFCADTWNRLGQNYPLRIVVESKQGTMFARKRGIDEARYRYLLFCDDDNWLAANYIDTAYKLIKASDEIAVVGGMGIPVYEDDVVPPEWMMQYEKNLGTGRQGKTEGDVTFVKGSLYTAGAIIDRRWLARLYNYGFTSILKGRDGKSLVAGEDTELTWALKLIGGKLFFSSDLKFKHELPEGRTKWEYIKRLWFSFGVSDYVILPYKIHFKKFKYSRDQYKEKVQEELMLLKEKLPEYEVEGDIRIAKIERLNGFLYAMENYSENFHRCEEVVALLGENLKKNRTTWGNKFKKIIFRKK